MNKTIIININGIVFHIEEDAYEVLKTYMTEVKRHFAYSPDSEEIVTDIENRLAEMFTERLAADHKQVIVLQDVKEVIEQMGSVSDFEPQDEESAYAQESRTKKKLFRDVDDRIIGGVCAGVGHYFDIEPRWVRLFMLLMFLFGGSGLVLYIILWIVMPKAVTRADKMAMKGEPINLQGFKKTFDEEVEGVRQGFTRAHQEASPLIDRLGNILGTLFRIGIKVIGAFIIFICAIALFGLVVGISAFLGAWNLGDLHQFPFNIVNPEYKSALSFSAFVLVFIPLVALISFAVRVIFNRRMIDKSIAFGMLILWLVGLFVGIFYGSKVARQFSDEATFSQTTEIKSAPVYYLKLNSARFLSKEDSLIYDIDRQKFYGKVIINGNRDNNELPRNFTFRIETSDDDKPVLIQEFSSKGSDFETALKYAQATSYHFVQQDSILQFDKRVHLSKNAPWRDQAVRLTLRLPKNTRLIIDENLNQYLEDYNLRNCQPEDSPYETPSEWIMTDQGMKCKNDTLYRKNLNHQ
ncbi:MAG TPA: PspC domain-containing protein [Daejeonella sp.]|nr:PspC domain-containing protein [Daejeonella sp.]